MDKHASEELAWIGGGIIFLLILDCLPSPRHLAEWKIVFWIGIGIWLLWLLFSLISGIRAEKRWERGKPRRNWPL